MLSLWEAAGEIRDKEKQKSTCFCANGSFVTSYVIDQLLWAFILMFNIGQLFDDHVLSSTLLSS